VPKPSDLLQGTLDLLILKTIAREPSRMGHLEADPAALRRHALGRPAITLPGTASEMIFDPGSSRHLDRSTTTIARFTDVVELPHFTTARAQFSTTLAVGTVAGCSSWRIRNDPSGKTSYWGRPVDPRANPLIPVARGGP